MSKGEHVSASDHRKRLSQLRDKVKKQIEYHQHKPVLHAEDFYHLVTTFFLELLEKDYSATYEEIIDELENIEHEHLLFTPGQRQKAAKLLRMLSEMQYRSGEISRQEASLILKEFADLSDEFTQYEEHTLEHVLHDVSTHLRKGDIEGAKKQYQEAHRIYSRLGEEEKQQYYERIQELFARLSK